MVTKPKIARTPVQARTEHVIREAVHRHGTLKDFLGSNTVAAVARAVLDDLDPAGLADQAEADALRDGHRAELHSLLDLARQHGDLVSADHLRGRLLRIDTAERRAGGDAR